MMLLALLVAVAQGQDIRQTLCRPMTAIVVPGGEYRESTDHLQRIEIRRCLPGVADGTQLVAWQSGRTVPTVIRNTAGGDVLRILVAKNIFAAEISGGSRNHVYVIAFESGTPKIVLHKTTADRATLSLGADSLIVVTKSALTGDAVEHEFPTK
jgi:hypothetical protein